MKKRFCIRQRRFFVFKGMLKYYLEINCAQFNFAKSNEKI